jgi:enoyl-CoA hydratase
MGLANRVVDAGQSLVAAQELAAQLARFPQTCLRQDRLSLLEQQAMTERHGLANELAHGLRSLAEAREGIERFRAGEGRHGEF